MQTIKLGLIALLTIIYTVRSEWPYSGTNAHWHTFSNPNYRGPHAYHPSEHGEYGTDYDGPVVDDTE